MPKPGIHFQQGAMATFFEGWLIGEDLSHLRAVAQVLQEEILRIEQLLSRHDPRAELARLNREVLTGEVQVERELLEVLADCLDAYVQTAGFFDIGVNPNRPRRLPLTESLVLDSASSRVSCASPLSLDLGGYGKGYALDKLGEILSDYGVEQAFLHGGTSSCLALGTKADGSPWTLSLPNQHMMEVSKGFSCSATYPEGSQHSDILDPDGVPLQTPLLCTVQAETATQAEIYSTALLAMGEEKGLAFLAENPLSLDVQFFNSMPA